MDPNRPKGPYAPEFVFPCMRVMGNGAMGSRVDDFAKIFYESVGISLPERNLPDETTQRRWRYGMHYVCMVQVGEVLTRAIRNGDIKMALTSDGTPVITDGVLCTPSHVNVYAYTLSRSMDITSRGQ